MDEDEVLEAAPPAVSAAASPADSDPRPEIVRLEFPISVVVVGSLTEADIRALRDAVIGDLQDALDDGF